MDVIETAYRRYNAGLGTVRRDCFLSLFLCHAHGTVPRIAPRFGFECKWPIRPFEGRSNHRTTPLTAHAFAFSVIGPSAPSPRTFRLIASLNTSRRSAAPSSPRTLRQSRTSSLLSLCAFALLRPQRLKWKRGSSKLKHPAYLFEKILHTDRFTLKAIKSFGQHRHAVVRHGRRRDRDNRYAFCS
jgi:hypothetical protein